MTSAKDNHFLLLFGSQTGNAEAIAQQMQEEAATRGLDSDLYCLNDLGKKFELASARVAVVVCSTTGEGDPPDNALRFCRGLRKKNLPSDYLKDLRYTILGLGDTNYTNFCNGGKTVDSRLRDKGARTFYDCGWADDGTGLDIVVEPWLEGLWASLKTVLSLSTSEPTSSSEQTIVVTNGSSRDLPDRGDIKSDPAKETSTGGTSDLTSADKITDSLDGVSTTGELTASSTAKTDNSDLSSVEKANPSMANSGTKTVASSADLAQSALSSASETPPTQVYVCLNQGAESLASASLSLPALPPPFLTLTFEENEGKLDMSDAPIQNGAALPSAASPVTMTPVTSCRKLTRDDALKTALEVQLDVSGCGWKYEPGDAVGIVSPNSAQAVQALLTRLGLDSKADIPYDLRVLDGTRKKNAAVPPHVPTRGTLRHVFSTCLDFRSIPKKVVLRVLAEYATEAREKRRVLELSSRQAAEEYMNHVRQPGIDLLDVLHAFPSCMPPVERLIEHLPRLQARPYSASSSLLHSPGRLSFVFNIVSIPIGEGRSRDKTGVCTGWLSDLTRALWEKEDDGALREGLEKLELEKSSAASASAIQLPIFLRTNQRFRLPEDLSSPVLMIGPGTGVAPFVGFLRQREALKQEGTGDSWLFYGCRHRDRDFLYREELTKFHDEGLLTRFDVVHSRDYEGAATSDEEKPRYVQHVLKARGKDVATWLVTRKCYVYVCGDARGMSRDVYSTLATVVAENSDKTAEEAEAVLVTMRKEGRYHEDVWS